MADYSNTLWLPAFRLLVRFQKRMPAEACVFVKPVPGRNPSHTVPENAAEVAHFLLKGRGFRVRVALGVEQKRMTASDAHVLVATVRGRGLTPIRFPITPDRGQTPILSR